MPFQHVCEYPGRKKDQKKKPNTTTTKNPSENMIRKGARGLVEETHVRSNRFISEHRLAASMIAKM